MGDARKHNTLFYEHNPTDPRVVKWSDRDRDRQTVTSREID